MNLHLVIPISDEVKKNLQHLCYGLPSIEWVDPDNFFIFLYTFHEADGNFLLDLKESLAEFSSSPFSLKMREIVPTQFKKGPGLLEIEMIESEGLRNLIAVIEKHLKNLSIKEKVKYKPHILLGKYLSLSSERLVHYLEGNPLFYFPALQAERLQLLSSQNRGIYHLEADLPLR